MAVTAKLHRVVGFWGAVWMGLGSILGTGVFVSLGIAAGIVGPSVVLAVFLASLVATANGISSAQLAAAHPVSGGTYEYGHQFVHPVAGYTAGWMFLLAKSASAATAALGFSGYFLHLFGFAGEYWLHVSLSLSLLILLTFLVSSGMKRSNTVNIFIVSLTLLALGTFIFFGWLSVDIATLPEKFGLNAEKEQIFSPMALLQATALMFVAYTGYGRIATLGEEVQNPEKIIPRAIIGTLVISMILYLSVSATAVAFSGAESFAAATDNTAAPLEIIARGFSASWVAVLVAIGAITAMAGVLLNLLLGLSRVLFAMARRREMPVTFAHVNAGSQSPSRAVWAVGGIIAVLVLLGDIKLAWSFSAFTVLIYYGITNLAALRIPKEARRFPRWISLAGLLACFGLAFFVDWKIWLVGLLLLGLGFILRIVILKFYQKPTKSNS